MSNTFLYPEKCDEKNGADLTEKSLFLLLLRGNSLCLSSLVSACAVGFWGWRRK